MANQFKRPLLHPLSLLGYFLYAVGIFFACTIIGLPVAFFCFTAAKSCIYKAPTGL